MSKSTMKPAYLDREALPFYTSLSESTLNRMIVRDEFPKPRQLNAKRVGWLVREIDEWAESRPVSSNLPVANCQ